MKRVAGSIVVAVLIGAGSWFFGLGILSSIVVALVIAALGLTVSVITSESENRDWPTAPPVPADGARRDTSELSWALRTRSGFVDEPVIERLHDIALNALARRHLDIDNPAHRARIERLLGAQAYALVSGGGRRRARVPNILAVLGALENLDRRENLDSRDTLDRRDTLD